MLFQRLQLLWVVQFAGLRFFVKGNVLKKRPFIIFYLKFKKSGPKEHVR
jgi:hypothetical protein